MSPHLLKPASAVWLLLAASSCAPQPAGRQVSIDVDAGSRGEKISLAAYLPNEARVHPGGTVVFRNKFSGEPHTVTLGRLVDRGISANAERQLAGHFDEAPELQEVPSLSFADLADRRSRLRLPCFLDRGAATRIGACRRGPQPDFDGRQSFFSSGVLAPGGTFTVKLSTGVKPGAYAFFCLVHRARMVGQISVVDPSVPTPGPERNRRRADEQLSSARNALDAAVQQAAQPEARSALAGVSIPQLPGAVSNVFVPPSSSIPTGGSLTWTAFGSHAIAFNAPQNLRVFAGIGTGLPLDPEAIESSAGPPPPEHPPVQFVPGTEQPSPTIVEGGEWDGRGLRTSGILFSFAPALVAYRLTFTSPGSYDYRCLLKPSMRGTVVVG